MLIECHNCGKEFITEADPFFFHHRHDGDYYSCGCKEVRSLEKRIESLKSICERMTDNVQGLDDDDIESISLELSKDPQAAFAYVKFLIGLYHKEKSATATWRLKYEKLKGDSK